MEYLTKENITLAIAIIGCIGSIIGLTLHFYSHQLTTPKIKLELDPNHSSFYFDATDKEFNVSGYKTKFSAFICIKIINASSFPVTVDRIYIDDALHDQDFTFTPKQISRGPKSYTYWPPTPSIELPCRVEAFDIVTGSVRFPFFDTLVLSNDSCEILNIKLSLHTPRKVLHLKVNLCEYPKYADEI